MKVFDRKTSVTIVGLVFTLSMFIVPMQLGLSIAYVQTRNTIAVVQIGSDRAIEASIVEMNLTRFNHPIAILQPESPSSLRTIVENSIFLVTIYVGHGSSEGLVVGAGVVPWSDIGEWIEESTGTFHILVACHSREAVKLDSQNGYGFPGIIDSRVAGLLTQIVLASLLHIADLVGILLARFFAIPFLSLVLNPRLPLAWGPWSSWMTNEALNDLMTGGLWLVLAAGIVAFLIWAGPAIIALCAELAWLGWLLSTGWGAWIFGGLVGLIGAMFCKLELWYRTRYDPTTGQFWDQSYFALKNTLYQVYWWYSITIEAIHY